MKRFRQAILARNAAAAAVSAAAACLASLTPWPASAAADQPSQAVPPASSAHPAAVQRGHARPPAQPTGRLYGHRADVMRYARDTALSTGLDRRWIAATLAQARYQASVAKLVMPGPPGTRKNWAAYRDRFIEPGRIAAGTGFWDANAEWLSAAERRFGVPAAIIVGIIGVETHFGRLTGGYRVIDALATLSFDFPKGRSDRSAFFREELSHLLVWASRDGLDPLAIKGSYAGAVGLPQFMPGSVLDFAVDFDGDQRVDLAGSVADAIGSVAAFLAGHGWVTGLSTHVPATPPEDAAERARLLAPDILPTFSLAELVLHGARVESGLADGDGPLALVELDNGDDLSECIAATRNFYALTRYNRSAYYARAVAELGAAISAQRAASAGAPASTMNGASPSAAASAASAVPLPALPPSQPAR
jgi:membrane-bound lytic murein transglycosylase B